MKGSAAIALAAAHRADWRVYLGLVWPRWSFIGLAFAVLVVEATFNVGLFSLLPIADDSTPGIVDEYHAAIGNPVAPSAVTPEYLHDVVLQLRGEGR